MPGCLSCSESEGHSYYCILFTGQESRSRLAELGPLLESGVGRTAFSYGGSTGEGPASKLAQAVGRIHLLAYGLRALASFWLSVGDFPSSKRPLEPLETSGSPLTCALCQHGWLLHL